MVLTCGCEVSAAAPARLLHGCAMHSPIGLRDHFAAAAFADVAGRFNWEPDQIKKAAEMAYALADAMLAEREKGMR